MAEGRVKLLGGIAALLVLGGVAGGVVVGVLAAPPPLAPPSTVELVGDDIVIRLKLDDGDLGGRWLSENPIGVPEDGSPPKSGIFYQLPATSSDRIFREVTPVLGEDGEWTAPPVQITMAPHTSIRIDSRIYFEQSFNPLNPAKWTLKQRTHETTDTFTLEIRSQ